jgi:zinc protease
VAKNAVVALVGAIDRTQAEQIAERITSGLAAGAPAPALPPVPDGTGSQQRIPFPSTQAHLYLGQPGMTRTDPDYFPLYVGNHILGGNGLVSLLSEEVREKRGLSYSVSSYFVPMREKGPFILGLQTKNSQAEEAKKVLLDTLNRFRDQGPTAKELEDAKKNITGGFPLRIASNAKIIEYLAVIGFYGLPLDYLDQLTTQVEAVSTGQIRDAFQRRVDPAKFDTILVGPNPPAGAGDAKPAP